MATGRTLKPAIRCAIYTRQSVKAEPGEDLTSCEAQREHCGMFIESQKYEGWERVRQRFDDVGESGATLERPALRRLRRRASRGRSTAWSFGSSTV